MVLCLKARESRSLPGLLIASLFVLAKLARDTGIGSEHVHFAWQFSRGLLKRY